MSRTDCWLAKKLACASLKPEMFAMLHVCWLRLMLSPPGVNMQAKEAMASKGLRTTCMYVACETERFSDGGMLTAQIDASHTHVHTHTHTVCTVNAQ